VSQHCAAPLSRAPWRHRWGTIAKAGGGGGGKLVIEERAGWEELWCGGQIAIDLLVEQKVLFQVASTHSEVHVALEGKLDSLGKLRFLLMWFSVSPLHTCQSACMHVRIIIMLLLVFFISVEEMELWKIQIAYQRFISKAPLAFNQPH
jgi:hypothetical protein